MSVCRDTCRGYERYRSFKAELDALLDEVMDSDEIPDGPRVKIARRVKAMYECVNGLRRANDRMGERLSHICALLVADNPSAEVLDKVRCLTKSINITPVMRLPDPPASVEVSATPPDDNNARKRPREGE